MAGIFKAYDIRGIYGDTLTPDIAFGIGRAFATFLECSKAVVGRDMRPHSGPLFDALAKGLNVQGCDVVNLGLCSSPMDYCACGQLAAEAGIMITASHNPGQWNGFKLMRENVMPLSGLTGIGDIEKIFINKAFAPPAAQPGRIEDYDILPAYKKSVAAFAEIHRPVRVAADMANAMGVYEARALEGLVDIDPLYDELDGTFPNHEANPLKTETLAALQEMVRAGAYDFGVAFDGDADRAGFVDENGDVVPMDIITALIAQNILTHEKGVVFYDLRSSWAVKEVIAESGGTPMMCRVGHAFIKRQMRESNAIFAGELSGHYYFRNNFNAESSAMAVVCLANMVSLGNRPLSQLVAPLLRYHASGEINSEVADPEAVLGRIRAKYRDGHMFELDGFSVEYDDWWFNVRKSNTEPLVRLNLEAKTPEQMAQKRDELLAEIRA